MDEDEIKSPAQIAQEKRKQEVAERSALEERERVTRENRIKDEKLRIEAQRKFEQDLIEKQATEQEAEIEARRTQDAEEGDAKQQELQEEESTDQNTGSKSFIRQQIESQADNIKDQIENYTDGVKGEIKEQAKQEAQNLLKEHGFDLDLDEVAAIEEKPPTEESFPVGMVFLAVIKDITDVVLAATFVGVIVAIIYTPIYLLASLAWALSLTNRFSFMGKLGTRIMIKFMIRRFFIIAFLEISPAGVLPLATVFVLLNHYSNKKSVQIFMKAAEMIAKGGK